MKIAVASAGARPFGLLFFGDRVAALTEQRPPLSETPVEHESPGGKRFSREGAKTLKNS